MEVEEARRLLAATHPDAIGDDRSPEITEALEALEQDPEGAAWLREEQAFDRAISGALRGIEPPAGLEKSILSACREGGQEPRVHRLPWFRPLLAAAAVAALAGALVKYFLFPPPVVFPPTDRGSVVAFQEQMAWFCNQRFRLDHETPDLGRARRWLAERHHPIYAATPPRIVGFRGLGCKALFWGEHKVSLVCFRNEERDIVHLFVVPRDLFDDLADPAEPLEVARVEHRLETVGWSDEALVYCLVGSEPGVEVAHLAP